MTENDDAPEVEVEVEDDAGALVQKMLGRLALASANVGLAGEDG